MLNTHTGSWVCFYFIGVIIVQAHNKSIFTRQKQNAGFASKEVFELSLIFSPKHIHTIEDCLKIFQNMIRNYAKNDLAVLQFLHIFA